MANKIVIFRDDSGDWRWHKVAPNNEKVATSGEAFDSMSNAVKAGWREAEGTDATVEVEGTHG